MKLIYDVGAHQGEDTDFYLKKGFRVVAVEANPNLAQGIRERFGDAVASKRLIVVQSAVAERDGEIEFFLNTSTVWGTIHESWADRNAKLGAASIKTKVQALRFEQILRSHGVPYYLKVDIEGADMLCVRALKHFEQRPTFISIESNKTSWRELVAEFDEMERLGYKRFKVVDQSKIQTQCEPLVAREGISAHHRFAEGSTGLFGSELDGPWISARRAKWHYAFIFLQYRFFGDNAIGEKWARRLPWRIARHLIPNWYDTHAVHSSIIASLPS